MLACEQAFRGDPGGGKEKGRRACNSGIWIPSPIPLWLPVDWAVRSPPISAKEKRARMWTNIKKQEPRVMTSLIISYPPISISNRFFSMQIFKFQRQSCKLFFLFPPRRACSCSRWSLTYMMKPRISSSCVRTTKSFVVVFVVVLKPRRPTSLSRIDFQRSCQHRICHRSIEKSGRK